MGEAQDRLEVKLASVPVAGYVRRVNGKPVRVKPYRRDSFRGLLTENMGGALDSGQLKGVLRKIERFFERSQVSASPMGPTTSRGLPEVTPALKEAVPTAPKPKRKRSGPRFGIGASPMGPVTVNYPEPSESDTADDRYGGMGGALRKQEENRLNAEALDAFRKREEGRSPYADDYDGNIEERINIEIRTARLLNDDVDPDAIADRAVKQVHGSGYVSDEEVLAAKRRAREYARAQAIAPTWATLSKSNPLRSMHAARSMAQERVGTTGGTADEVADAVLRDLTERHDITVQQEQIIRDAAYHAALKRLRS